MRTFQCLSQRFNFKLNLRKNFSSFFAKPRQKRALQSQTTKEHNGHRLYTVRTCSIYLQADHRLYMQIFNKEGNRDHVRCVRLNIKNYFTCCRRRLFFRTREEIVSLFYNHIKAVNHIYETTDFGGVRGLNFVIQRTTVSNKNKSDDAAHCSNLNQHN